MKKRKVKLFASIASLGLVVAVMGVGVWAATQQAVKVSSQVSFTATSVAADIKLSVNNAVKTGNGAVAGADAKYDAMKEYDIVKKATLSHEYKQADPSKGIEANTQYAPSEDPVDILYSEKVITADTDEDTNVTEYTLTETPVAFGDDRKQARRIAYFTNDYAKTLYENRVFLELQDKDEDGYLNIGAQVVYTFTIEALISSAPIYYHVTANLFATEIFEPDPTTANPNPDPVRIQDAFEVQIWDNGTLVTDAPGTENDVYTPKDIPASAKVSAATRTETANPTTTLTNWTHGEGTTETTGDQKAIQPGETREIQVIYTVKDMDGTGSDLYQGISYTMQSLELGDIYIKLANNGKNITDLPDYKPGINGSTTNAEGEGFDKFVDWITGKEEKPEISQTQTPADGD